jgi:hypothetical protein
MRVPRPNLLGRESTNVSAITDCKVLCAESTVMPSGLRRFQQARQLHFVTFSCYLRQPKLATTRARSAFEQSLERTRRTYAFCVAGFVVMPEHI